MKLKLLIAFVLLGAMTAGIFVFSMLKYDFATLKGQKYKHSDLRGQVIVVNYFAEWCAPCLREIPHLNEFQEQMPDDVKLFAISYDNLTVEKLNEIKQKYNIDFPLIGELKTPFNFEKPAYLPATFIIKANGVVAGQLLGEQTVTSLNEAVSPWRTSIN